MLGLRTTLAGMALSSVMLTPISPVSPSPAMAQTASQTKTEIRASDLTNYIRHLKKISSALGIIDISEANSEKDPVKFAARATQMLVHQRVLREKDRTEYEKVMLDNVKKQVHFATLIDYENAKSVHYFSTPYGTENALSRMDKQNNTRQAAIAAWTYAHEFCHTLLHKYTQLPTTGIQQETAADVCSMALFKSFLGPAAFNEVGQIVNRYRMGDLRLKGTATTHGVTQENTQAISNFIESTPAPGLSDDGNNYINLAQSTAQFITHTFSPNATYEERSIETQIIQEMRTLAGFKTDSTFEAIDFNLTNDDLIRIRAAATQLRAKYISNTDMEGVIKSAETKLLAAIRGRVKVYDQDREIERVP